MTELTNELRRERLARGWTQVEVARLAGISRQSYAAIEAAAVPSTETALRLAAGFGRAVEKIFRLPHSPAPRMRARWSGGTSRVGTRVRIARVAGSRIAIGVGEIQGAWVSSSGVVTERMGEEVEVGMMLDPPPEPSLVLAGCDPAFGLVAQAMWTSRGIEVLSTQRGSRAALAAVARGDAHIAGAHLRDPRGGDFNARWVREEIPFPCTAIRFATWEQGLLVAPGNPLGIESVEDLARPGIRFLNREPGSGSRALVEECLRNAGIAGGDVAGYQTTARGHLAVAEAIATGLADAGVAIRAAGSAYGLDVVPLAMEPYELIVPDHFLDLPGVQILVDALMKPGVRGQVEALGGYDVSGMGTMTRMVSGAAES